MTYYNYTSCAVTYYVLKVFSISSPCSTAFLYATKNDIMILSLYSSRCMQ